MITINYPFTNVILIYISPTFSHTTPMLTSTLPKSFTTFLNYMSVSITCITKPPCTYNFVALFKLLLCFPVVWLDIFLIVTNFMFIANVISNAILLTNIKSAVIIKMYVTFRNMIVLSHIILCPPWLACVVLSCLSYLISSVKI